MTQKLITDCFDPDVLSPLVLAARERRGWSIAELARHSNVEFSSVSRVENPERGTGVLTALKIAETAKVLDLEECESNLWICDFFRAYYANYESAREMYKKMTRDYLSVVTGDSSFEGFDMLEAYQTHGDALFLSMNIREPLSIIQMMRNHENFLDDVLPRDLGSFVLWIFREATSFVKSNKSANKLELFTLPVHGIWKPLSVGRSYNVNARRFHEALGEVEALVRGLLDAGAIEGAGADDVRKFAESAYRNYLVIDKIYMESLAANPERPIPHCWRLVEDLMRMHRVVESIKAPGRKIAERILDIQSDSVS